MKFTLRLANQNDIENLFDVEYELFPDNNFNERTLAHEVQQGTSWVVYDGETLVGYTLCRRDELITDILRLGVREKYRRTGVASALLKTASSLTSKTMLTVRKGNDAALALYRKHGFDIVGTMPQDYSWAMLKNSSF
jgi:ribosomal-protein-alanine N-acetyltransferase